MQDHDRQRGGEDQGRDVIPFVRAADAGPQNHTSAPCEACGGAEVLPYPDGEGDCWMCVAPVVPAKGLFVVRLNIDGDYEVELNGESESYRVALAAANRAADLFRVISKRRDIRRVPCEVRVYRVMAEIRTVCVASVPVWTPRVVAAVKAA